MLNRHAAARRPARSSHKYPLDVMVQAGRIALSEEQYNSAREQQSAVDASRQLLLQATYCSAGRQID